MSQSSSTALLDYVAESQDMLEVETVGSAKEKMHYASHDVTERIKGDLAPLGIVTIPALGPDGSVLLERALGEGGVHRILALYEPAQWGVARGIAASQSPTASLAAWKAQATSLLSVYRKHRRRVTFAALAAIEAEPERFRVLLREHLGLTSSVALTGVGGCQNSTAWKTWHVVLARQAVATDPDATLLDGELEAAALPLAAASHECNAALTQLDEVDRERVDLETERDLLIQQLSEMQATLLERLRAAQQEQESLVKAQRELEAVAHDYGRSNGSDHVGDTVAAIFQSQAWNVLPKKWRRRWQLRVLGASGLLDTEWYLQYHQDVAEAKVDPVTHYLIHGAQEGRPPSPNYL